MNQSSTEQQKERPRGVVRRLYDWMLSWAETRYGTLALFLISFAESSFFPLPPDVLQIALSVSKPKRAFFYATVNAVASVLGGIFGWYIGYALWEACGGFFLTYVPGLNQELIDKVGNFYKDNAFWSITGAAFTPIPYKAFTISAGIFHDYVSLQTLIIASIIGRSSRFFLVASAIFFFGPQVKTILEKHLEWISLALFAAAVLGFLAIKFLFR